MKYLHRFPHKVGERVETGDGPGTVIKIGPYNHEGHQWCRVQHDDGTIVEGTGFTPLEKRETGAPIFDYELSKEDGIVFIKWIFQDRSESEWLMVGEAPYPEGY